MFGDERRDLCQDVESSLKLPLADGRLNQWNLLVGFVDAPGLVKLAALAFRVAGGRAV